MKISLKANFLLLAVAISAATHSNGAEKPEIPFYDETEAEFIIANEAGRYTLIYDTCYRHAKWVAHILTREDAAAGGVKRSGSFRSDPEVVKRKWPAARNKDYTGSGYDRGHLLPSADRNRTAVENRTTFHMSNVSPQAPGLNRGVWKNMEEKVRKWAGSYDSLYIITGCELKPEPERISNGVGVPERFYKAILTEHNGQWYAIAFLMPNVPEPENDFMLYILSVDELEAEIKIDLFLALPDCTEEEIESKVDLLFWQ